MNLADLMRTAHTQGLLVLEQGPSHNYVFLDRTCPHGAEYAHQRLHYGVRRDDGLVYCNFIGTKQADDAVKVLRELRRHQTGRDYDIVFVDTDDLGSGWFRSQVNDDL